MTTTGDMRYGRQGGRIVAWHGAPQVIATLDAPGDRSLVDHLAVHHGLDRTLLTGQLTAELRRWHDAEHRTREPEKGKARHSGHLTHDHPGPKADG